MHGICAREMDFGAVTDDQIPGPEVMLDEYLGQHELPTPAELQQLADALAQLVNEITANACTALSRALCRAGR